MMFACERPYAFYGLIALIPAVIVAIRRYRMITGHAGRFSDPGTAVPGTKNLSHLPRNLVIRTILRCLSWVMLVFAYAGFSWGTYEVPVQKSGDAVCFVFDISYSMNAADAPGGLTRLRAAAKYADILLSHMDGVSVSVVLSKGDGVVAVPLTEDTAVVRSLLDTLSPDLMTAAGTSLGKGVSAALKSFPADSAQTEHIWVFTDGDETDGQLQAALSDCVKYGVRVSLIGFGTERETEVTAGDGKTRVHTALRSAEMRRAASLASRLNGNTAEPAAVYVDATEPGSALRLLTFMNSHAQTGGREYASVSYEIKPVERYALFLAVSIVLFILSFIVSELNTETRLNSLRRSKTMLFLVCLASLSAMSCKSGRTGSMTEILRSTWAWHQKNYRSAIAGFLRAQDDADKAGDAVAGQYAQYNLASTYMQQNEYDVALQALNRITPDAPAQVKYAAYYNTGIIAYHNGDYQKAIDSFRNALKIDGSKIEAKENLEIARHQQLVKEMHGRESSLIQVHQGNSDIPVIESKVFQRIRENDQKQWKNSKTEQKTESAQDY